MLYVRTEQRHVPGGLAKTPAWMFVATVDRAAGYRWLPADGDLPGELALIHDPLATARADALFAELRSVTEQRDSLAEALKRAVGLVPVAVANDLRRIYREALGHYGRGTA